MTATNGEVGATDAEWWPSSGEGSPWRSCSASSYSLHSTPALSRARSHRRMRSVPGHRSAFSTLPSRLPVTWTARPNVARDMPRRQRQCRSSAPRKCRADASGVSSAASCATGRLLSPGPVGLRRQTRVNTSALRRRPIGSHCVGTRIPPGRDFQGRLGAGRNAPVRPCLRFEV
jgi:hypothetical protein